MACPSSPRGRKERAKARNKRKNKERRKKCR